jgi:hypothetical protein
LREVEAEAVALLCCEALNLEGSEFCRGYIQNWLSPAIGYNGDGIPEKSAQKIFAPQIRFFEQDSQVMTRNRRVTESSKRETVRQALKRSPDHLTNLHMRGEIRC